AWGGATAMNHRHLLSLGLLALTLLPGLTQSAPAANLEEQLDIRPNNATRGQSRDVADGWIQLGNEQSAEGNLAQAADSWAEAAEIYRLLGDTQSAGRAYGSMGAAFATPQAWFPTVAIAPVAIALVSGLSWPTRHPALRRHRPGQSPLSQPPLGRAR
ncbi:MAG TPA: hypothetical protein VEZ50_07455, partial [Nodosilinea sp.]|nr:hypothetical protein [Nodosilinea sp.]